MTHLFVLFPFLVLLGVLMARLAKKYPENITFRYFRNFILVWSVCTVAVGAAETFSGKVPVVFTTLAFVLPFLYVASSYLVRVPFALAQKEGSFSKFLSIATIGLGIFYGLSLFIMVQNLQVSTGPLAGLFTYMSENFVVAPPAADHAALHPALAIPRLLVFHMITILAIFVPVGLFFLYGALKTKEMQNRIRSALVGIGLIAAGIAEWYHVAALHSANRDFFLVLGFILVVAGLFYARGPVKAAA